MKSQKNKISKCFDPPHTGRYKLKLKRDKRCNFEDLLYNHEIINKILKPLRINEEP
jgi:hypothetical protein